MDCQEARALLDGYADAELDLRNSLELERHLGECNACALDFRRLTELKSVLREQAPRYLAPESLRESIQAAMRARSRSPKRWRAALPLVSAWRWPVAAAAAAVLIALIIRPLTPGKLPAGDLIMREAVASHVRSLMANHLTDVLSSNQHTVKPWFDGKLDFAPVVLDLSAKGFSLAGGRLDYIDGHPAAALVYRHGRHLINLFTWPAAGAANSEMRLQTLDGYNSVKWTESAMQYYAVSDVAPDALERFARLVHDGVGR